MNMKIKIKNKDNKLFVALVLIAALMMVSVAGVVMSDDAKGIGVPITDGNQPFQIKATDTGTIFELYPSGDTGDAIYTYTIPSTVTFSGTFSLGTMQSGSFVAVDSVTLTDVSNAVIAVSASWTTVDSKVTSVTLTSIAVTTYNTAVAADANKLVTSGTFDVTKGEVIFGTVGAKYFTGTANGIKMVNIEGLQLTNKNNNIGLSGVSTYTVATNVTTWASVTGGAQVKIPVPAFITTGTEGNQPTTTVDSTITVTENVTIGNLTLTGTYTPISITALEDEYSIDTTVELIIAEDVTATVTPTPKDKYGVVINTDYTGSLSTSNVALTTDSEDDTFDNLNNIKKSIYTDPFTGYKSVLLDDIPKQAIGNHTFNVAITIDKAVFNGTVTVAADATTYTVAGFGNEATFGTPDAVLGMNVVENKNVLPTSDNPIGYESNSNTTILFDYAAVTTTAGTTGYAHAYGINVTDGSTGVQGTVGTINKITFGALANDEEILIVLARALNFATAPVYDYFIGTVTVDAGKITDITVVLADPNWNKTLVADAAESDPTEYGHIAADGTGYVLNIKTDTFVAGINMTTAASTVTAAGAAITLGATPTDEDKILLVLDKSATAGEYFFGIVEISVASSALDAIESVIECATQKTLSTTGITITNMMSGPVAISSVKVINSAGATPGASISPTTAATAVGVPLAEGTHKLRIVTTTGVPGTYDITITIKDDGTISGTSISESTLDLSAKFNTKTTQILTESTTDRDLNAILTVEANNTMTVDGTLLATAKKTGITSNGTTDVEGMITTGTDELSGVVNAVHYDTTADGSVSKNFYTTLTKAMEASSDITIMGKIVIKEDTILGGSSETANAINISSNAILEIGVVDKSIAVVTVPTTTTLDLDGEVQVINGQFKWVSTVNTEVKSAVFIIEDKVGVYTDLTSALTLAKDGSTVTLRDDAEAEVKSAATVATGVTLDAKNKDITIEAGGKLTVDGKLVSTGKIIVDPVGDGKLAGEFVVNSKDVTFSSIELSGTYTIGSGVEFAGSANIMVKSATESAPSVMNVNGTYTNTGQITGISATADFITINVAGKYVNSGTEVVSDVELNVFVTGEFNATIDITVEKLTVTGSGKVTSSKDIEVTVVDYAYIGDAATTNAIASASTNNTEVTITLSGDTSYATVFGKPADGKVKITNDGAVNTELYLGDDLYATLYGIAGTEKLVKDIENPEMTGYIFRGYFTTPDFEDTSSVESNKIGALNFTKLYVDMDPKKFVVSFQYEEGIKWLFDGIAVPDLSSNVLSGVSYGEHKASFAFMDGYSGNVTLTMDGKTYTAGQEFTLNSNTVFAADGAHKTIPGDSMDMIEILLIVITIVFVIVAIVVIMRLMRS